MRLSTINDMDGYNFCKIKRIGTIIFITCALTHVIGVFAFICILKISYWLANTYSITTCFMLEKLYVTTVLLNIHYSKIGVVRKTLVWSWKVSLLHISHFITPLLHLFRFHIWDLSCFKFESYMYPRFELLSYHY